MAIEIATTSYSDPMSTVNGVRMQELNDIDDSLERNRGVRPTRVVEIAAAAVLTLSDDDASALSSHDTGSPATSGIRPIHQPMLDAAPESATGDESRNRALRVERLIGKHFRMVWRVAQRFGLQPADAEDVALRVMLIASNRIDDIAESGERGFLVSTTRFVACKVRKALNRRREMLGEDLSELAVEQGAADDIADQRRALAQLDHVLAELPEDLRTVFVLFEIEGFSQSEIGTTLGIPQGTVASRIRRAKKRFLRIATRANLIPRGTV
jgi:RNA polymerase sigma-70 factor, ECF subfamily